MDTLQSPELAAPPPEVLVDVAVLRRAVEAAKPSGQMIMVTAEQLETLLLVVDENALLRDALTRSGNLLRGTIGVIDEVLEVGLAGNPKTVPPPAPEEVPMGSGDDVPDDFDRPNARRKDSRSFFGEGGD